MRRCLLLVIVTYDNMADDRRPTKDNRNALFPHDPCPCPRGNPNGTVNSHTTLSVSLVDVDQNHHQVSDCGSRDALYELLCATTGIAWRLDLAHVCFFDDPFGIVVHQQTSLRVH